MQTQIQKQSQDKLNKNAWTELILSVHKKEDWNSEETKTFNL